MTCHGVTMTTTNTDASTDATDDLVARAAAVGAEIGLHAADHDRFGTFVDEGFLALRESGLLAAAVPRELGGGEPASDWCRPSSASWPTIAGRRR